MVVPPGGSAGTGQQLADLHQALGPEMPSRDSSLDDVAGLGEHGLELVDDDQSWPGRNAAAGTSHISGR